MQIDPTLIYTVGAQMVDTTVSIGGFYTAIEPYVIAGVGSVITAVFAWLTNKLRVKLNLDIDAQMRDSLQTAATNAATKAIVGAGASIKNVKIDVGNPMVAEAIRYVESHAPDAVKYFKLDTLTLQEIILAKLGAVQVKA